MTALRPPSVPGHWLWGNLRDFQRDMLGFFARCTREHGDLVALRFGPRHVNLANHPDFVEQVLVTENRKFGKSYVFELLRPVLGNGLVTSEGDFWLRQRRLIQPFFSRASVNNYAGIIVEHSERVLKQWQERIAEPSPSGRGQSEGAVDPNIGNRTLTPALSQRARGIFDLHREMSRLTLSIVGKALMDIDLADEVSHEVAEPLEEAMKDFSHRFESAWNPPMWVPTRRNQRAKRNVRKLDAVVNRIIRQRRESGLDKGDFLSKLMHARDDDQTGMTDRQLRDEVMTMFLAGHETTANALGWTWFLLGQNPAAEQKLLNELNSVVGNRSPDVNDVPKLAYTEAVLKESMRLYPPAYAFSRRVLADAEIGGFQIDAGSAVIMSQWVIHRDPRWWHEPEKFLPERWLNSNATAQNRITNGRDNNANRPVGSTNIESINGDKSKTFPLPRGEGRGEGAKHIGQSDSQNGNPLYKPRPDYAYFPFGGGPRGCIGNTFAMLEATLVVATLAPKFRFELVAPEKVRPWPSVTLRPSPGIDAIIHERSPQPGPLPAETGTI